MDTTHLRSLNAAERRDWLRLIRTPQVGPLTFHQLLHRYGGAGPALDALPDLARRGGRARPLAPASRDAAERELAAVAAHGARMIAWCEPDYPATLRAVEDAPPLICVRGAAHLLDSPMVALVGARNASAAGRRLAGDLAGGLGRGGVVVVSGLARGIDTAAHQAALATGTVAVIAAGIDNVYPPENADLHAAIAEAGVLIAEMAPGTPLQARHFPRRNRLIAGLCLGVVVVEAARRSGSLITARLARDYGREVFAVPGSPLDPRAEGGNHLIQQGACLVQSADDVLSAIAPLREAPLAQPAGAEFAPAPVDEAAVAEARPRLAQALSPTPVAVDEVVRECQLSAAVVATALLELELAGRLERHPGNRVALI